MAEKEETTITDQEQEHKFAERVTPAIFFKGKKGNPTGQVLSEEDAERARMSESLKQLKSQKKVRITISSTETQKDDVKVGVNGHVYQIPRDVESEVPEAVAHALENAKITMIRQQKRADGEEGMENILYDVARFPMSTKG